MGVAAPYSDALNAFADRPIVTIATGTTCAYLGDERNLREFLVADETARVLRRHGHTVFSILVDDSYDPLTYRQLRVAVNKDPRMIEAYEGYCGKPIAHVPDPWGCHGSLAAHFESQLLQRLNRLGAHPTIVSTANLYEKGVYRPYVEDILLRLDDIQSFLAQRFPHYTPRKLVWVLCPQCDYIDSTQIQSVNKDEVCIYCERCQQNVAVPFAQIQAKLNWKLDCALRWKIFEVDAEPFNKAYLEPQAGAFSVAQALCQYLFDGQAVLPLLYGLISFENELSYKLLKALPPTLLRKLLTEKATADMNLTKSRVLVEASRYEVLPETTYTDAVKQLLPVWMMTPDALTNEQRELLACGTAFSESFLDSPIKLNMPSPKEFAGECRETMEALHRYVMGMIVLRQIYAEWEGFLDPAKRLTQALGDHKKPVVHRLRKIVGQEQGPSMIRFLFSLPLEYINVLEFMLRMHVETTAPRTHTHAVVNLPAPHPGNISAYVN